MEASATTPPQAAVQALEGAAPLDGIGKKIGKSVRSNLGPGKLKDALSGTWIGHAVHPLLTDVVIGSWTSATLLDLLGGDRDGTASERLIAIGIAAYGPTALAGVSDWADSEAVDDGVRRVGLVHAATNSTALALYVASLAARRKGARGRGVALGAAGAAVLGAGGYLGGHLSFAQGVGPNQTAFDPGPTEWTAAGEATSLTEGAPRRVVVDDTPVMLVRSGGALHAVHDRCSHRGCSLTDGEVEGSVVTCRCHGSQFDLEHGTVLRGPATSPQPAYEVRESGATLEIKRRV